MITVAPKRSLQIVERYIRSARRRMMRGGADRDVGRNATGEKTCQQDRRRYAERHCRLARPAAGVLMAGNIVDLVYQGTVRQGIGRSQNISRYLHEIGAEQPVIPARKNSRSLRRLKTGEVAQHDPGLGDSLHNSIFDAVMDYFDKMPDTAGTEAATAGLATHIRCDSAQHRRHNLPRSLVAADHDSRAMPRALFTARDARAEQHDAVIRQGLGAARRIHPVCVTAVDNHIAWFEVGAQGINHVVHGLSRLNHEQDSPRARQGLSKRTQCGNVLVRHGGRNFRVTIVDDGPQAMLGDVERQIAPHHTKPDNAKIRGSQAQTSS